MTSTYVSRRARAAAEAALEDRELARRAALAELPEHVLEALRADEEAATTLDLGPFGPDRDRFDARVHYAGERFGMTRTEADAARADEAVRRAASDALPF